MSPSGEGSGRKTRHGRYLHTPSGENYISGVPVRITLMPDEGTDEPRGGVSRRGLLLAASAAAGLAAIAGCSGVTSREFVADEVVLPTSAQSSLGFEPVSEDSLDREFNETIGGQDVSVRLESFLAVYEEDNA